MLVEKGWKDALRDYAEGKTVMVMTELVDGTVSVTNLDDIFPEGTRVLVEEVK